MHKLDNDDIAEIGVTAVSRMVEEGLISDCTDTDDGSEFDAQDIIREVIVNMLAERNPHLINLDDGDIQDLLD